MYVYRKQRKRVEKRKLAKECESKMIQSIASGAYGKKKLLYVREKRNGCNHEQ